jgi:hypothetical protein
VEVAQNMQMVQLLQEDQEEVVLQEIMEHQEQLILEVEQVEEIIYHLQDQVQEETGDRVQLL